MTTRRTSPALEPYEDGDMPGSIRVAVASDKDEEINAHFGYCRFLIYQLARTSAGSSTCAAPTAGRGRGQFRLPHG